MTNMLLSLFSPHPPVFLFLFFQGQFFFLFPFIFCQFCLAEFYLFIYYLLISKHNKSVSCVFTRLLFCIIAIEKLNWNKAEIFTNGGQKLHLECFQIPFVKELDFKKKTVEQKNKAGNKYKSENKHLISHG